MSGLSVGLFGAEGRDCAGHGYECTVDYLVSVFSVMLGTYEQPSRS